MRNSSWEDDLWQEISINSVNSWLSKLGFLYRCSSYSCLNSFGYFPSFAHTHIPSGSPAVTPSVVPLSLPSALLTTISTDGKIRNGLSWIFIILFFGSPFRLDFIVVPITDQRYRRNSIAIQHSNLCISYLYARYEFYGATTHVKSNTKLKMQWQTFHQVFLHPSL